MFRSSVLGVLLCACLPAAAGEVSRGSEGFVFREDFRFQGNHAATIASGAATTVWWDEASWDVRGDSNWVSVTAQSDTITNRFHVDIHKALSADPRDGRLSNTVYAVGGDGSPGVGVMHLDFQDILSARLRNPLLISPGQPAVVSFHAPVFNTTGHWWELAITPASDIVGGESTAVPGQGESGLPGGTPGSGYQPGPGHEVAADSINLVSFGASDVPCSTGWLTRFGVTRSVAGVRTDYVNPVAGIGDYLETDPSETDTLVAWRAEFRSDGVALFVDLDGDGEFALMESWSVSIPWSEVHLHLLGVAYQADHHPQEPCYLGHIRELKWRDVQAWPVKYAATDVFPKNQGIAQLPTELGWRGYDLRDIQRFGSPINEVPQPNTEGYGTANRGRWCNDAGYPCFGTQASVQISANMPGDDGLELASARFVYDTKDRDTTTAAATLTLNGTNLGLVPGHDTVPATESQAWVRRAVDVPTALLTPGAPVTVQLALDTGMYLDRLEIETGWLPNLANDRIFADDFDADGTGKRAALPTRDFIAPDRGEWRVGRIFGGAVLSQGRWLQAPHCSEAQD